MAKAACAFRRRGDRQLKIARRIAGHVESWHVRRLVLTRLDRTGSREAAPQHRRQIAVLPLTGAEEQGLAIQGRTVPEHDSRKPAFVRASLDPCDRPATYPDVLPSQTRDIHRRNPESQRGAQPGGTRADDGHVILGELVIW